jgi:hypothetical protein
VQRYDYKVCLIRQRKLGIANNGSFRMPRDNKRVYNTIYNTREEPKLLEAGRSEPNSIVAEVIHSVVLPQESVTCQGV